MKGINDPVLAGPGAHCCLKQFVHAGAGLQSLHREVQILIGLLELASPSNVALMELRTGQGSASLLCEDVQ